jgi:hypothetical protein
MSTPMSPTEPRRRRSRVLPFLLLGSVSLAACAGVLGLKKRDQSRPFEHYKHLSQGIGCLQCHQKIEKETDQGPPDIPSTAVCVGCHSKPHNTSDCSNCHGQASTRAAVSEARDHLRFQHAKHLGRLKSQCVPCHVAAGTADATILRPVMGTCLGCHQHRDQWRTRDCDGCHHDLISENVKPDSHIVHDGNWVREHGVRAAGTRDLCATCHNETFCTNCHGKSVPALPWKLNPEAPNFSRLHAAGFFTRHPEESHSNPGLCSTCHADNFCRDCHDKKKLSATGGGANPHPVGWVKSGGGDHGRQARLDPMACAACHGGAGEQLCVGCHRVGGPGGSPHGSGFSSTRNKTRDEPCRKCHGVQ